MIVIKKLDWFCFSQKSYNFLDERFFLVFVFLGLNFSFLSFLGYPFTSSTLFSLVFCLGLITRYDRSQIVVSLIFIFYFLLIGILNYELLDKFEFIKTFFLCVCFFVIFTHSLVKDVTRSFFDLKKVLGIVISVIMFFLLLQVTEHFIFDTHSSWFLFDSISTSTATDEIRFKSSVFQSYIRPISIYYEPSYLGFVLFLLMVANIELKGEIVYSIVAVLGVILTVSSVSYIFLFTYVLIRFFSFKLKWFFFLVGFFCFFWFFDGVRLLRIEELTWVGTSGYQRITEPLLATIEYLSVYPFGLPLGQAEFLFNNSFFVFVLYFGVMSPLVVALYMFFVFRRVRSTREFLSYFVVLGFLLNLNGSIFTPDGAFFVSVLNYIYLVVGCDDIPE